MRAQVSQAVRHLRPKDTCCDTWPQAGQWSLPIDVIRNAVSCLRLYIYHYIEGCKPEEDSDEMLMKCPMEDTRRNRC